MKSIIPFETRKLEKECQFKATRSSGPGGQNVNKVNTKIELRFQVISSQFLSEREKERIIVKLGKRIQGDGFLVIQSQQFRSQLKNKEEAIRKLYALLGKVLKPEKKRKKTAPTPGSREKRLEGKRMKSATKINRKKVGSREEQ